MYLVFKTQSWSQTSPTHFMWISLCILWYSRPRWHCTGVTKSCSSVSVEQAGQLPVSPTGGSDAFTAGWDAYFDPFCQSGTTFVYFKNPFAPSLQLIYLQQNLLSPAAVSFYFVCTPLPLPPTPSWKQYYLPSCISFRSLFIADAFPDTTHCGVPLVTGLYDAIPRLASPRWHRRLASRKVTPFIWLVFTPAPLPQPGEDMRISLIGSGLLSASAELFISLGESRPQ